MRKTIIDNYVQAKVHRAVTNLSCGCKRKTDGKLKRQILQMVIIDPQTTSKEIRSEHQDEGIKMSGRTICHHLSQSSLNDSRGHY